jgi:hypothetical protein
MILMRAVLEAARTARKAQSARYCVHCFFARIAHRAAMHKPISRLVSNLRNGIEVMRRHPLDKKRIPHPGAR